MHIVKKCRTLIVHPLPDFTCQWQLRDEGWKLAARLGKGVIGKWIGLTTKCNHIRRSDVTLKGVQYNSSRQ